MPVRRGADRDQGPLGSGGGRAGAKRRLFGSGWSPPSARNPPSKGAEDQRVRDRSRDRAPGHWSAYDGRARRPRAEALRAVCACGWRGAAEYLLDWATFGDRPQYEADVDPSASLADWTAHLSVVHEVAVPLPEPWPLLVEMAERLTVTAEGAPLAALRAAGVLERMAAGSGGRPSARCATTACLPKRWPPGSDHLLQGPGPAPDRAGQVTARVADYALWSAGEGACGVQKVMVRPSRPACRAV